MKNLKHFICLLFFVPLLAQAKTTHVVTFDCTRSMIYPSGIYKDEYRDSTLWNMAKLTIKSVYENMVKYDERFVLLLFQDNVIATYDKKKANNLEWKYINNAMEKGLLHGGNTCILSAWEEAEKYFDENTNFYFITDGIEDHDDNGRLDKIEIEHIHAICNKIRTICNSGNIKGFYTNLKESENNIKCKEISDALNNSCFHRPIIGKFDKTEISLDENDLKKRFKLERLTFIPSLENNVFDIHGIQVEFTPSSNGELSNPKQYFRIAVKDDMIRQNKLELSIEVIKDVPSEYLKRDKNGKYYCDFNILIKSKEDEKVCIYQHPIKISAHFYFEKVAYLTDRGLCGESSYHPAFFISSIASLFNEVDCFAEHAPDPILFNLKDQSRKTLFNIEALRANSHITFKIVPKTNKDSKQATYTLFFNGKKCPNNKFILSKSDSVAILKIILDKESQEGVNRFYIKVDECSNIDKINDCCNLAEFSLPIELSFEKNHNILNVIFLLLLLCIILGLLVRIIFVRRPSAIMNTQLYYVENNSYELLISLRNCTRGIISNHTQKQSFLSKIFNGTYHFSSPQNVIHEDIHVYVDSCDNRGRKRLKLTSRGNYTINGVAISNFPAISKDENKEYMLQYNESNILTIKYL